MSRSFSKIRHIQEVNQRLEKRLIVEQSKEDIIPLMKKVWLKYLPMGFKGIDKNSEVDNDVIKIQKWFNKSGMLGPDKKYSFLKEDGIFGDKTFSQINDYLGAVDQAFWSKNKYRF